MVTPKSAVAQVQFGSVNTRLHNTQDMMSRGAVPVLLVIAGILALSTYDGWRGSGRLENLEVHSQRIQSLEAVDVKWEVPNTFRDDEEQVASGAKVLNKGHINWYFIPPKAHPAPDLPRRLDASGVVTGDPNSAKSRMSPLVLDHVFTEDTVGKQAWANVHAWNNGELLTGQMRLVHKQPYVPPPPPENHVDLDGVLHGVMDEAIASAFAKVMAEPPPRPPPPPPSAPSETEDTPSEEAAESEEDIKEGARIQEGARAKLEPISDAPAHLPWESENIEKWHNAYMHVHPTPPPTTPPPVLPQTPLAVSDEDVAAEIAENAEKEERTEEEEVKVKEESPEESMECSSSIYSENGCCCQIPFEYGGITHTNCTLMDHTSFWCYTQDTGCGKEEKATGQWWDHCWPAPVKYKEKKPPPKFKRKHHKKHPPGRKCGEKGHHNAPWYYHSACNDKEVCNYRCKDTQCRGCSGGNCKCVPVKKKGQTCGDGTRRGPTYSNYECDTGKCAYNCDLCFNCDGGNCVCVQKESIRGS